MIETMTKRTVWILMMTAVLVVAALGVLVANAAGVFRQPPIRIGILHSLSGTMAISEQTVVDAALLAVEEINAAGGILGRQIEPLVVDGQSDNAIFAAEAERLIAQEGVSVVFGCWTSACRRTVRPIFERYNHLLIYPVQYEGIEQSPNIIYTGSAPNQQIIPAVTWSLDNLGQRAYLVGSDYVFPRTANAIIRDHFMALGGEIVGEDYLLLGSDDVAGVIERIVAAQPDMLFNSINGDSNVAFFAALRAAGITPETTPVMSFSIAEPELRAFGTAQVAGDYAAWTYFQSLPTDANAAFIARFRARYGADRVLSDPMEAAYAGVHVWAQAVAEAGKPDVEAVQTTILNRSYTAPQGVIYIDGVTRHTWKAVRIGRIQPDGQFVVVWDSGAPIRPIPYPDSRTPLAWNALLEAMFQRWNGWENTGDQVTLEGFDA
jgi:urea transport system substrate-binding protein